MKFFNALFSALLILALPFQASGTHLRVKKPGTLRATYERKADKKSKSLKITGRLNNADVAFLRLICGSDDKFNPVNAAIKSLDLTDVEFVPEADSIAFAAKRYRITSPHKITSFMFYGTDLEEIILPAKTDSVAKSALAKMPVRKLTIPQGVVYVSPNAVNTDSLLTELHLPAIKNTPYFATQKLPMLKKLYIGDTYYVMSGSFADMPELEEVCFEGLVGHIDGYQFRNNPKLRKVSFKGPIVTTGGPALAEDCPALEEYEFNDLIVSFGFEAPKDAPAFKGIKSRYGALLETNDSIAVPVTPADKLTTTPEIISSAKKIVDCQTFVLKDNTDGFLTRVAGSIYDVGFSAQIAALGIDTTSYSVAYKESSYKDLIANKIELLKASAPYKPQPELQIEFRYALPTDSLLAFSRQHFNLDSIAGNGPASERIKNLTYWVHDLIRHDGGSGMPKVMLTLPNVAEVCKKEDRGVNCRGLAIILTEALLAEGIPARYLTCESKAYNIDGDCHVICAAWAEDLGKWVWADPTFAAFVTDENGLMLHPGEVRQRLIDGRPLILNEDANWNHKSKQTKEGYLEQYMAKNLYLIQAAMFNRAAPEGRNSDPKPRYVSLVPEGFDYDRNPEYTILTTDYDLFWQPPVK